jgi:hypothetical protein
VVYNTVKKAMNMVYMMQMTESFIHQYEEYTRKVDCLKKEVFMVNLEILVAIVEVVETVFNERKHNMKEFAVQKWDINMIEDTNTGIVVNFKSVEVVRKVIIVENIMIEDANVGDRVIFKFGKTVVIRMECNTAERQKKLAVKEGDINMSRKVFRTAIVEVVRTAITKGKYNTVEIEKKLTVQKGDTNNNLFEDIHMGNVIIVKSVKVVETVKKVMINNMIEYNTAEMHEELIVKEVNIIMLEGTNMRDGVIKMVYGTAEMKKRITVKEMKNTRKREDFWSFRDMETRHSLIWEAEGDSWESAIVFLLGS